MSIQYIPAPRTGGTMDRLIESGEWDNLPDIASARLPAVYEAAKLALANCERIDECKEWADKSAALASYAKQSGDESLYKHAMRIQSRATRCCGELLRQIPSGQGSRNQHTQPPVGTVTRQQAATDAGMSERQRVTALRVAAVPEESFERQVESEHPPTVTALADQGRMSTVDRDIGDTVRFQLKAQAKGALRDFDLFCTEHPPAKVAAALVAFDVPAIIERLARCAAWLAEFETLVDAIEE